MDVLLFLVHTNIMPQSLYQYFYASVILNICMCALCVHVRAVCKSYMRLTPLGRQI